MVLKIPRDVRDLLQQIGEYANDYIEVRRDYSDRTALELGPLSDKAFEMQMMDITHTHGDTQQEVHHRGNLKEDPPLELIPEKTVDEVTSETTGTL